MLDGAILDEGEFSCLPRGLGCFRLIGLVGRFLGWGRGVADVRAVMNRVREAELSGSVRLIGDIELNSCSLSKGVFYGMVTDEMANNARWGAERTEPAAEVTK